MDQTEHPLTPEEVAILHPVGDRLRRLVAVTTTNLVHNATYKPVPTSLIGMSMKAKVGDAYETARQRLVSAQDHFRSVLTLIAPESALPSFSLFTLLRGAGIATVHARHLLDPTIDETVRLGRGLSARLENVRQVFKVMREVDPPEPAPPPWTTWQAWYDGRADHLRQRAIDNKIAFRADPNGVVLWVGEDWLADTELFDRYMPGIGKIYFRYLSGYANSLPWAPAWTCTTKPWGSF